MPKYLSSFILLASCFFIPTAFAANEVNSGFENALSSIGTEAVQEMIDVGVFAVNDTGTTELRTGVTRAEFMSTVMTYLHPNASQNSRCFDLLDPDMRPGFAYNLLFSDVSVFAPYATELCTAMITGVINGYDDGSFRTNDFISFAEAAKILNVAFALNYDMPDYDYQIWYESYVHQLEVRNAVPESVTNYIEEMTREEATETVASVLQSLRKNPVTYPNEWLQSG